MIKLRKLVTGAMNIETRIRKYHGEARDDDYTAAPMHAPYGGRKW